MFLSSKVPVEVSGGFWLLLAWFALANSGQVLMTVLGAAAVHELGHYVVLKSLGGNIRKVQLNVFGAVMDVDGTRLSYGREVAAVLAGPAANFLCAWACLPFGREWGAWDAFLGANLILGAFNLLPIRPLDGGRTLYLIVSWLLDPITGENIARWTGTVTALLLAAGLGYLMWRSGGSLWLLPAAVGAVGAAAGEIFGKH